ncbi:MAG TPA: sulfatase [Candidatus Binatia bacterium]
MAAGTKLRAARVALALVPSILLACERAAPPTPPATVDVVARRLTARDFGQPSAAHAEVVKLGDEARPVVLGPRYASVASLYGVLLEGGRLERPLTLPDAAAAAPDDAFALEVQELPLRDEVPQEIFAAFGREPFKKRLAGSWRLVRDEAAAATARLEFTPQETKDVRLNVDLLMLEAQPDAITSGAFQAPSGATLELGYGVAEVGTPGAATAPLRFVATLLCENAEPKPLLDDTVAPDAAGRWRDAAFPLATPTPCRLELRTEASDARDVRRAVWAQPRITAALAPKAARDAYNVVLISLDTLRADRLSGHGYPRETTPIIDAELIARGTSFRNAMSTFPQTDISHLSLFTSLYPDAQPERGRLPASSPLPLLTERLADAGFLTAAFTEDALVAGAFGFWFGFDLFFERTYSEHERGARTFADGVAFLRDNREQRFFLFLHTYKTHVPYVASAAYAELFTDPADWEKLDARVPAAQRAAADAYDRTVREADDLVGTLLRELDALGLAERTIVVLLSDHGEAFGEHGALEHGFAGHQEQMAIPLVFRGPEIPRGVEVEAPVSLVDVAPTILELVGAEPLPDAQGLSLAPAFAGGKLPGERPLFFSWHTAGARGVRHGRWKFLHADHGHELFDLEADPLETRPLLRREPARKEELDLLAAHAAESEQLRARLAATAGDERRPAISDEVERSLRALGYLD